MGKWTGDRPYDYWHFSQEAQGKYRMGYTGFYRDNAQPDSRRVYDTYSPSWWEERGKVDAKAGKPSLLGWLRYDKGGVRYYVGDGAGPRSGDPPAPSAQEAADLALKPAPAPSTSDSAYLWGYLYAFISTAEPTFQSYPADSYEFWREQGLRDAFAFRPKRTAREISWRAEDGQIYFVGHGADPTTDKAAYYARLASAGAATSTTTDTTSTSTSTTSTTTGATTAPGSSISVQFGVPLGGILDRLFGQQPMYGYAPYGQLASYASYNPQYGFLPAYGAPGGISQVPYAYGYGGYGGAYGATLPAPVAQPFVNFQFTRPA